MKRFRPLLTTDHWPLATLLCVALACPAQGQGTTGVEPPVASTPAKVQKLADLTNRYRFSEKYTPDDEKAGPGLVGSCRVGLVEVVRDSVDSPQGAPKRSESTRQAIFTERPAEAGGLGGVAAVTRTFERFRAKPEDPSRTMGPRPLEGLTALIRPKQGELPQIISLTEGRQLTDYEYDVAAHEVFVPQLAAILPSQALRVGDTWRIPRKAAQAMLGDPYVLGDTLVGKLSGISKEVDGPRMVASIAIAGKATGPAGDSAVNAEALFTFTPESTLKNFSPRPTFPPRPTEDVIEARGAFTELRLGRMTTGPLPGPGRLRFQSNREVILQRQLGLNAGAVGPARLEKPPEVAEANAWLVHVDPAGHYAFRHPQDMLPPERVQAAAEANTTLLARIRREGRDMLQIEFVPKILAPEDLKKELGEKIDALKMEVIKGAEEWLPEADWPKMRVHRVEAALKVDPKGGAGNASTRIHFDAYLILFGQSASIMAIATTSRDAVAPFRREVEQALKSIQLDPARPSVD